MNCILCLSVDTDKNLLIYCNNIIWCPQNNLIGGKMNVKDPQVFVPIVESIFVKLLLALLSISILFSCTTTKPASIDPQLTMKEGFEQIQEGLRIYMRPIQDQNEIKKYFGANILEKDILPIFVLAENKSGTEYFLIEPADLYNKSQKEYMSAKEAKKSVYDKDAGLETALILTGPVFWLAAIPIAMADYGPTDASKWLQQALVIKSLRKQTLTPGKTESGFLYYHIPADISSSKKIGINLKATNLNTRAVTYFRFAKELNQEGKDAKK